MGVVWVITFSFLDVDAVMIPSRCAERKLLLFVREDIQQCGEGRENAYKRIRLNMGIKELPK